MEAKEAVHQVIVAFGQLKACYPPDSEQARNLDSIIADVIDVVCGGKVGGESDENTKDLRNLLGKNAHRRLKHAVAMREIDDAVIETLEKSALLDEFVKQSRG